MTDTSQIFREPVCGNVPNTDGLCALDSITTNTSGDPNIFTCFSPKEALRVRPTTEPTSSAQPSITCPEIPLTDECTTESKQSFPVTSFQDILSNPPVFQPPPLRRTFVAPILNNTPGCQLSTSPSKQPAAVSSFPSPFSAFTQLQPKSARQLQEHFRNVQPNLPIDRTRSYSSSASDGSSKCSSTADSPVHYDVLSSSASSSLGIPTGITLCVVCGQMHSSSSSHRYHYSQAVDADLCCCLCRQPLVEPLETKCGHTFCAPCLKNHLAVQALCPVDRQIINYLECQQASKIVQRLLDKLVVVCPNSRSCGLLMHRASLEEHLRNCCSVSTGSCENRHKPPTFIADSSDQSVWRFTPPSHFSAQTVTPSPVTISKVTAANLSPVTFLRANLPVSRTARFIIPPVPSISPLNHHSSVSVGSAFDRMKPSFRMPLPNIEETYDSPMIPEGAPVSVVIRRPTQCSHLGFAFVGGSDTPLSCILIQEIYLDGLVAVDGRLRPGDQILEVNGRSLATASHHEALQQLTAHAPCVQLTVFRESMDWKSRNTNLRHSQDEIFHVKLCKRRGRVLGIKLVGKRHLPGLYVLELVPGCEAALDGRLQKDDQILEINGINLSDGSQEQAAHIINTSADFVDFKVRRGYRSDTPDILRTAGEPNEQSGVSIAAHSICSKVPGTPCLESQSHCGSDRFRGNNVRLSRGTGPGLQRTRSVQSDTDRPLASPFQTETSSLHASQTASSFMEGEVVATSTSPLLDEDEDQELTEECVPDHTVCVSGDVQSIDQKDFSSICQERIICVEKSPEEPLGISVAGGRHSLRGDTPVYVTDISPECAVGRKQLIKRGDILLEVNGVGLVGLTHSEAVNALRSASRKYTEVQLRLLDAPETWDGLENFMPSWKFWLQLPLICQLVRIIHLRRNCANLSSGQEPLGFSILGGLDAETTEKTTTAFSDLNGDRIANRSNLFRNPIVIKSIVPGLLAHRDGRLKCGDIILAVNSISMLNISHNAAVQVFKKLRGDVTLQIISWPGTIV